MSSPRHDRLFDTLGRQYVPLQPTAGRPGSRDVPGILLRGVPPFEALVHDAVEHWGSSPLMWALLARTDAPDSVLFQRNIDTVHEPLPSLLADMADREAVAALAALADRPAVRFIRFEIDDLPSGPHLSISVIRTLANGVAMVYRWADDTWHLTDASVPYTDESQRVLDEMAGFHTASPPPAHLTAALVWSELAAVTHLVDGDRVNLIGMTADQCLAIAEDVVPSSPVVQRLRDTRPRLDHLLFDFWLKYSFASRSAIELAVVGML